MNTTKINKTGISMTQLKLIGIILIVFDHIHEFFQFAPEWFSYLGRPVAPIFLFSLAEGMHYTSNRKKYLFRLYIGSVLMAIGNTLIVKYIQWMMIFASIFMLLYNGEKGNGSRKIFYIFYPAHIYLLYTISVLFVK